MRSLVLCYAESDEPIALELGRFIEASLPFEASCGEAVVRPDFDLIDAAERGLSADAALVLLSPASVPKSWRREKWEPVFFAERTEFKTPLGLVLLRECRFPELLRRERFFDLSQEFTAGARAIKRWLLRPDRPVRSESSIVPHLAELRSAIADKPGLSGEISPAVAEEFIERCGEDFETVFRIDCRDRSRAGIVGDIGHAVGLRVPGIVLPGTLEENRRTLDGHCREHRWLFVFENLSERDRDLAAAGGRSSAILTHSPAAPVSLDDLAAAFFAAPRDEPRCMALLGAAGGHLPRLLDCDFEAGLRLGWALVAVLKNGERFAETLEVLETMKAAAGERADKLALFRIDWELSWIRGSSQSSGEDGGCILPTAGPETVQLALFA